MKIDKKILSLIKSKGSNVRLDLGCGEHKNPGSIGIDKRQFAGVDIVHDLEVIPYPLPDGCASVLIAGFVVQQLKPWLFMDIMNEWWRLLQVGGKLMISAPYAGSFGAVQDPLNIRGVNEAMWAYFDPFENIYSHGELYKTYKPKPWKIEFNAWNNPGNLEVVLEKRRDDKSYHK
jgi:hypothetical protein